MTEKTALEVITEYFDNEGCEDALESVLRYFDTDQIVGWFVEGYLERDEDALIDTLGEEDAQIVIDHYDAHCA